MKNRLLKKTEAIEIITNLWKNETAVNQEAKNLLINLFGDDEKGKKDFLDNNNKLGVEFLKASKITQKGNILRVDCKANGISFYKIKYGENGSYASR